MTLNNNASWSAHQQRTIVPIDHLINPLDHYDAGDISYSIDEYKDADYVYAIIQGKESNDRFECLRLSKELVFSVESQRYFSDPIHIGLVQKGYIHLICVLTGEVSIKGPDNKDYKLQSQHGFISRYGNTPVFYSTHKPQTYSAVSLVVSPQALHQLTGLPVERLLASFNNLFAQTHNDLFSSTFTLNQRLLALLVEVINPTQDSIALRQLFLKTKLLEFVYHVVSQFELFDKPSHQAHRTYPQVFTDSLNKVRRIIDSRLANPPSINELSHLVGMNGNKLSSGFKQLFGVTPYQYGLHYRLQTAQGLLETGKYSVAETAELVGYQEASSFSRAFRLHLGVAPREIATQQKN